MVLLPGACLDTHSFDANTLARSDAWPLKIDPVPDFRIVRCILGLFWLLVACLAYEPNGWLQVGMASGMMSVKVHEWCLVCYVWLAAALATTSMLSSLFSYAARLVSP